MARTNIEIFKNIWIDLKMRCDKRDYEINIKPNIDEINNELKMLNIMKEHPTMSLNNPNYDVLTDDEKAFVKDYIAKI